MRNESKISLNDIYRARKAIDSWINRTPLVRSNKLSSATRRVFLKLETVHDIGAFKIRGASSVGIAALMNNLVEDMGKEVVTIISSRNINMEVFYQILGSTKPYIARLKCLASEPIRFVKSPG